MNKCQPTAFILLCSVVFSGSVVAQQKKRSVYFIQGAVRNSGVYTLEGRPSVLELIQAAGGLTDDHTSTALIIRESQTADGPTLTRTVVDINSLTKGLITDVSFLQPGDIVLVQSLRDFFVSGEVNAPSLFPYKKGMTLRQAISLAQGTTYYAVRERVRIFRENAVSGKREELIVDLDEVMKGKREDVAIEPGDLIVVQSSRSKSFKDLHRLIDTPPLRGLPSSPQKGSDKNS